MAAIAAAPVNLTSGVLTELTSKIEKQTEVKEVELSDTESLNEQTVVFEGISRIGIVHDHVEVRTSLHEESVHLRSDLQLHLRSVMRTGDEMLVKIRGVIEELDTAVHARKLAELELHDVEAKRDILKKQLDLTTKECSVLRIRLLEMSRARDRAEIELESVRGLLLEKTEECNELKRESARLHIQIADLSKRLLDYTSRLTDAESKIRFYITEIEKLKAEVETQKKIVVRVEKLSESLAEQLKVSLSENKELKIRVEHLKGELTGLRAKIISIKAELEVARVEVHKFKQEKIQALKDLEQAIKDRDRAVLIAEEKSRERDDAIVSRDQAIFQEQLTNKKWIRDSALLEDAQTTVNTLKQRVIIITDELECAHESSRNFEHLRDEALENFREADRERHHLIRELQKAREAKKQARLEVQIVMDQVKEAKRTCDIVIKEKEQVEIVLGRTEREKNTAIAAQLKISEEYIEADRQRDEAIKKYEDMEDLFQEADKALAVAVEKLDATQTAEKAASFKVEQLTAKLEATQKSEATLKEEKTSLTEEVKTAKAGAEKAKSELTVQVEKYTKDTTKLQKDLTTVQANEQVLIKSNRQLVDDKANLSKQLATTKNELAANKKNFESPIPEAAGIVIRHIFFGSVRITSPAVYQKVLDSYTHQDGCAFTVNSKFVEGADPDHQSTLTHPRYLAVYYAVRKNGVLVDKLPIWYKEGSKDNKFHPQ